MKRRIACLAVAAITAAIALPSVAQPARPYRVAWVSAERKNVPSANLEAFRGGLRELGYVEGRDLVIEAWLGEGSSERVRQMVPAMLAWQPDLIVASSGLALFPLKAAGVKQPIVFLNDKTAKALGIAIAPSVLARADEVIR